MSSFFHFLIEHRDLVGVLVLVLPGFAYLVLKSAERDHNDPHF